MDRKVHAAILRNVRRIHRALGVSLFAFFMILAITGLLLGWKKNLPLLQKPTQKAVSTDVSQWLPMDTLLTIANAALEQRFGDQLSNELDKLDVRPGNGIIKVLYKKHYYSFQIDATTGVILSTEYRTSDLVEHIHDGTFIDNYLNLPGGIFKLFYTTLLGTALAVFVLTGFWLWYGPKWMRHKKT